jgi:hypothetical protein
MTQIPLPLERDPLPPNPYKTGSQCFRIYHRLQRYGRVKNIEIMLGLGGPRIMNTTGRCSSIRKFLRDYGINLNCQPVNNDGVHEYFVGGHS